jgi:hypothetical protein
VGQEPDHVDADSAVIIEELEKLAKERQNCGI